MITDRLFRALAPLPRAQRFAARVLRHLPHRQRTISHRGASLAVDPAEHTGFYLYYARSYDDHVFSFLDPRVDRYARALDVGANVGVYATYLGSRIPRVDAFEPDSAAARSLRANLERNGLAAISVHEVCVTRQTGEVRFSVPDARNSGVGRVLPAGQFGSSARACPAISLDDFLAAPVDVPTLVKMDIEGAEWDALHGARRAFGGAKAPISLLLETHPPEVAASGGSMPALAELLESLGFAVAALRESAPGVPALAGLEPDTDRFWWAERP